MGSAQPEDGLSGSNSPEKGRWNECVTSRRSQAGGLSRNDLLGSSSGADQTDVRASRKSGAAGDLAPVSEGAAARAASPRRWSLFRSGEPGAGSPRGSLSQSGTGFDSSVGGSAAGPSSQDKTGSRVGEPAARGSAAEGAEPNADGSPKFVMTELPEPAEALALCSLGCGRLASRTSPECCRSCLTSSGGGKHGAACKDAHGLQQLRAVREIEIEGHYEGKDQEGRWWPIVVRGANADGTYTADVECPSLSLQGTWSKVHAGCIGKPLRRIAADVSNAILAEGTDDSVKSSLKSLTSPEAVWAALEAEGDEDEPPVSLVRASWLTLQSDPIARRQDLPLSSFMMLPALQEIYAQRKKGQPGEEAWETLPIVAFSCCWLRPEHPDPDGQQLRLLVELLKKQLEKGHGLGQYGGLCPGYRGVFADAAVFWDWPCLHQNDGKGYRSPDESRWYSKALQTMSLWYSHPLIMVYLQTQTINPAITFASQGWAHYERSLAELLKPYASGRSECGWPMVLETGSETSAGNGRLPPLAPVVFAEELTRKAFKVEDDRVRVVQLYAELAAQVLRGQRVLSFENMALGAGSGARLAAVLPLTQRLEELSLRSCALTNDEFSALAPGLKCPKLRELDLGNNKITDVAALGDVMPLIPSLELVDLEGNQVVNVAPLAAALPRCAALQTLYLSHNEIVDVSSLAEALPLIPALDELYLYGNLVVDAVSLASAVCACDSLRRLELHDNYLGEASSQALRRAHEARPEIEISFDD